VQIADKNHDGSIDYDEFLYLMRERDMQGTGNAATVPQRLRNGAQGTARLLRAIFGLSR
jgi:Ca2+-binding EF-hand superfamily protein